MKTRKTVCLDGKTRTFTVDDNYATIDNRKSVMDFMSNNNDVIAVVAYTEIKGDVGYQNFNGFKTAGEAIADYKDRKKLVPKVGTTAYCDVMLFDKKGNCRFY